MKFRLFYVIICLNLLGTTVLQGQKAPVKFGKVSMEELTMEHCEYDTSAVAMVLCDYGYFDEQDFTFKRTRRIKILKKAGYGNANFTFYGWQDTPIRGKVFNLENGEIVESKLKNESIFRTRITEDYYSIKVSMPNVKVGSVIDISYELLGLPGYGWTFQETIPVLWSELRLPNTGYVDFQKNISGYHPLDEVSNYRWVGKNMPAFVEEAHTNSIENYMTKMNIEVRAYRFPGFIREYATSWDMVTEKLLASMYFTKASDRLGFMKKEIDQISNRFQDTLKRAQAALNLTQRVKWNGLNRMFSTKESLKSVVTEQEGSSADVNLLLLGILHDLKIDAQPVVLSTVDHGRVNPHFPTINKFNYVVVCTQIGGKTYFLDATDDQLPFGMLPLRCLNGQGRLILRHHSQWVDLADGTPDKTLDYYDLRLNEDLSFSGQLKERCSGFSAWKLRTALDEMGSQEAFINYQEKTHQGLIIEDLNLENLEEDLSKPVKATCTVKIKDQVNQLEDLAYFNLLFFDMLEQNPFKAETRDYPVNYDCPIDHSVIVKLSLPESVSVNELPETASVKLPDGSASFSFTVSQPNDQMLSLRYNLKINRTQFLSTEYEMLKEFYALLVKKQAEPVILNIQQ